MFAFVVSKFLSLHVMQADLKDFSIYLSSEKGLSSHTLEAYRKDTNNFLEFIQKTDVITNWNDVNQQHVVDFCAYKKQQDYAPSSICRYLVAIKVLFRFLKR